MTVRGIARLAFRVAADFCRGVAECCREMASDIADDVADSLTTLVHLNESIRDAFIQPLDDRLAGYEAHGWPHEDTTRRDGVAWR